MRFAVTRPLLALVLMLGLSACGGKAQFTVGGTISGLFNDGLVLSNGGQTYAPKANDTKFTFPGSISYGTSYNVTATAQPRHQNCTVANGADTAGRFATINIQVSCQRNFYTLSGTVNGLPKPTTAADGSTVTPTVTLINGSTGGSAVAAATTDGTPASFTLNTVYDGDAYAVTVLTNPTGMSCTVVNGTGIMGEAAVSNIVVNCVPNP